MYACGILVKISNTLLTTPPGKYHRQGKIRWAKCSRFQPHWNFRRKTFALPRPEFSIIKERHLYSRENFTVLLKTMKNVNEPSESFPVYGIWINEQINEQKNEWIITIAGHYKATLLVSRPPPTWFFIKLQNSIIFINSCILYIHVNFSPDSCASWHDWLW